MKMPCPNCGGTALIQVEYERYIICDKCKHGEVEPTLDWLKEQLEISLCDLDDLREEIKQIKLAIHKKESNQD